MGALLSFVQSKSQPQVMAATAEATLCWQDSAAAKRPKMEAREDVEHSSANTPFVGVFCICISILVEHSSPFFYFNSADPQRNTKEQCQTRNDDLQSLNQTGNNVR